MKDKWQIIGSIYKSLQFVSIYFACDKQKQNWRVTIKKVSVIDFVVRWAAC